MSQPGKSPPRSGAVTMARLFLLALSSCFFQFPLCFPHLPGGSRYRRCPGLWKCSFLCSWASSHLCALSLLCRTRKEHKVAGLVIFAHSLAATFFSLRTASIIFALHDNFIYLCKTWKALASELMLLDFFVSGASNNRAAVCSGEHGVEHSDVNPKPGWF